MKTIPLTKGMSAIVDDEDYEYLSMNSWCYAKGYAVRGTRSRKEGWCRQVHMHRVINNTPEGMFTDHINRNKLDNRKENLRTVDRRENALNNGKTTRGVYKVKNRNGWMAQLSIYGKPKYLGYYQTKQEAVEAIELYDRTNRVSKTLQIQEDFQR